MPFAEFSACDEIGADDTAGIFNNAFEEQKIMQGWDECRKHTVGDRCRQKSVDAKGRLDLIPRRPSGYDYAIPFYVMKFISNADSIFFSSFRCVELPRPRTFEMSLQRLSPRGSSIFGHARKPQSLVKLTPTPRTFTQNSQLLLVSNVGLRPQLPFLHPATGGRLSPTQSRTLLRLQLARLITTERKLYLKDQLWKGAKYTVYGWTGLVLIAAMVFGFQSEVAERRFPSPSEWTFRTRTSYRSAKTAENPDSSGTGLVDWSNVGQTYRQLIERLEDPNIDGQGLRPILQDDGDIYIVGLGKTGLDLSSKSEPWRRGYYTCLMGAAKAAENRDGWVRDTTRNFVFPAEVVIGPSNPRPKPVPYGAQPAPLEENCVPVFEPAETFYMKILTTHGFNSRQRLDAALAFADWLDFKGLPATAEDMYDWGLDIAMGSLPEGINDVIDIKTGIISNKATHVSSNVLLATTSLAAHHARNNNLTAALPIFLSVLRARRKLPGSRSHLTLEPKLQEPSSLSTILSVFKSLLITPPYPPAPSTGDEIPVRTVAAMCEEAGVMSHIGEILFASSSTSMFPKTGSAKSKKAQAPLIATADEIQNQQAGLSWTREAVDLAEATLVSAADDVEARNKCSECLTVGMDNWSMMVAKILKDERRVTPATEQKTGSWFWGSGNETEGKARWERESKLVEERMARVQRLLNKEADRKTSGGGLFLM